MTESKPTKRLYIETAGCQMNILDSEMVVASLRRQGYELTNSAESADTILFNTCSVREHTEEKTYNHIALLRDLKRSHPEKIVGVMGCMAQKDQQLVFERAPFVDLVVGPGQLHSISGLLEKINAGAGRQMAVSLGRRDGNQDDIRRSHESFDPLRDPTMRPTPYQAYLRIQYGCDKFCTYCVVPMTRGPEQGRSPEQIYAEARQLADQGCKEIVLLGQTVNSYKYVEGSCVTRLADLLETIHEIDGICRIKFVTNYPKDMSIELLQTVRDLPKCSPYFHVPAQSGSDAVLARMKRGYTVSDYMAMMERIESTIPQAAVASDFIVGFCGETDEDFQQTLDLAERCRFKNSFIFKYSVRSGTKAAQLFPDDVPEHVKQHRNIELLELTNRIAEQENSRFIGNKVEVLVEGPSKLSLRRDDIGPMRQMTGRSRCDRIVVWEGNERQAGQLMPISIHDSNVHTLFGSVPTQQFSRDVYAMPLVANRRVDA